MNGKRLADGIATLVVRRPLVPALVAVALAAASIFVLTTRGQFDADILNLLPSEFEAVRGLQLHGSEFEQSHELTFALFAPEEPDRIDAFLPGFLEQLGAQPWVERILDAPPMESEAGQGQLPAFGALLLLNLPPDEFANALTALEPSAVRAQLERLHRGVLRGSPAAGVELRTDPLGLLRHAARALSAEASLESTFDLRTADGTVRVLPVVTRVDASDPEACRELMTAVRAFVETSVGAFDGQAPEVRVTGHAAYVDEISASMKRDLQLTSLLSLFAISLLFWIGFRSLLPLIGIALILSLAALYTLAGGMLLLGAINVIAIGFCSILLGLGNDFSLLYYNQYLTERPAAPERRSAIAGAIREMTPGIVVVALTTAVGFSALAWSGSTGFAQLGILIATGVTVTVVIMPFLLFLFVRERATHRFADPLGAGSTAFVRSVAGSPARWFAGAAVIGFAMAGAALLPWRPLALQSDSHSLEPTDIPAAETLQRLLAAYPDAREPSFVVVQAEDPAQLRERVRAATMRLQELKAAGQLESYASPRLLLPQPAHFAANTDRLSETSLREASHALDESGQALGFAEGALAPARDLLEQLEQLRTAEAPPRWEAVLPPASPWWFLLERHLSKRSPSALLYLTPSSANDSPQGRLALAESINEGLDGLLVSGWSQTVAALQPWAMRELAFFGSLVAGAIALILLVVYRDLRAFLIHGVSLALAVCGTMATLKVLGHELNLLSVIAFPLMLAVGVDYGVHLILALRDPAAASTRIRQVLKPILISGLTTMTGFGALAFASNPSLASLGLLCAAGVGWTLLSAILFVVPAGLCFLTPARR